MKRQSTDPRNTLSNVYSRIFIYKELLQINNKMSNNSRKMDETWTYTLYNRRYTNEQHAEE